MKLGQRMSKLLVNCCIATSWWNKQTFEIAKYLIIYAYDLCTTLGSSEWVKIPFKDYLIILGFETDQTLNSQDLDFQK